MLEVKNPGTRLLIHPNRDLFQYFLFLTGSLFCFACGVVGGGGGGGRGSVRRQFQFEKYYLQRERPHVNTDVIFTGVG